MQHAQRAQRAQHAPTVDDVDHSAPTAHRQVSLQN